MTDLPASRIELRDVHISSPKVSDDGARHVLVFSSECLAALKRDLLHDSPLETAAFVLAHPVRTPLGVWRLLAYDTINVAPEYYVTRSPTAITLPPCVIADAAQRARAASATLILAHTHPSGPIGPSPVDLLSEERVLPALNRRLPGMPLGRLIVSTQGVHAALLDSSGTDKHLAVIGVGRDVTINASPRNGIVVTPSALEGSIFDRQIRTFGVEGQRSLGRLRVGIVGLGGTGSVCAQQLAHLGVVDFILIDHDVLEVTNLNRVVGAIRTDVGRRKIDIARDMILKIAPDATVRVVEGDVCNADIARNLLDIDLFLSCTDSQGSRAVLTQFAYQYFVPGIDMGVSISRARDGSVRINGRVQMLSPGLPCLLCGSVLDSEQVRRDLLTDAARASDPYIVDAKIPQPSVISLNTTTASLAITMLLSAVTGTPLATRHQRLRFEMGLVNRVETTPAATCPWCSASGSFARGDTWPFPGRVQ